MTISLTACRLCGERRSTLMFRKGVWDFVRCAGCSLVALSPLPTLDELTAYHDASYRDGGYATFAAASDVRAAIARTHLNQVRPHAPSGPWLDVGCSTGGFVAAAVAAGVAAEGLELSSVAVAEARRRGLRVHQGAVEHFTPSTPLAVVTAFDVIEHLVDPVGFARQVRAWLRADGILALTLPNIASFAARLMGSSWFYYVGPDHVHYFTPTTIRRLLDLAGYRDITVRPAYKPMTIDYAADQLQRLTPSLAPLARAALRVTPGPLRHFSWPVPLGEIVVTARPAVA